MSRWLVGSSSSRTSGSGASSRAIARRLRQPPERVSVRYPGSVKPTLPRATLSRRWRSPASAAGRLRQRFVHDLLDRPPGGEDRVLGHIADPQVFARAHRAVVRLELAGQDAQQRRLARAVRADEADVIPLVEGEREPSNNGSPPKPLARRSQSMRTGEGHGNSETRGSGPGATERAARPDCGVYGTIRTGSPEGGTPRSGQASERVARAPKKSFQNGCLRRTRPVDYESLPKFDNQG